MTQPPLDVANSLSELQQIDVNFSEEIKDGELASTYKFKASANHNFSVSSVQKISAFTYRLIVGGALQNTGLVELDIAPMTDYNNNLMDTAVPVEFTGNVNIPIVSSVNHNGVSTAGGYASVDLRFYHTYTADVSNANSYSVRLTSGAIDCNSGTVLTSGSNLAPGVGNEIVWNVPAASFSAANAGMNRLVVCISNVNNPNAANRASWPIIRDDDAPALTYTPAAGSYATTRTITLACGNNIDKIGYTSTTQQTTAPVDPAVPTFDASGNVNIGTRYTAALSATNPANPTYTKFMWRCIDIAGNLSAAPAVVQFYIDSTIPDVVVNLGTYRQYVSSVNPTTTLTFSTDQSLKAYNIRRNGTTCDAGGDGALLVSGVTNVTPGVTTSEVLDITTHFTTAPTSYDVRICVAGTGIGWGTAYVNIIRDDTPPTITANVVSGSYGALQSVQFTCDDAFGSVHNTFYNMTEADGLAVPALPTAPIINTATGASSNSSSFNTALSPADRRTTRYAFQCIDRAGNLSNSVNVQYTIDATLPIVTFVSQNRTAVSSSAGGFSDVTLNWTSNRADLTYRIRRVGDCDHTGTPANTIASGTVSAINTNQPVVLPVASFPTNGVTYPIRICVYNLLNFSSHQTAALNVTRDNTAPTYGGLTTLSSTGGGNFTLNWSAATDGAGSGIAYYNIYRSTSLAGPYTTVNHVAAHPATNIIVSVPVPTTSYYFVAGAVDNAGNETQVTVLPLSTKPTVTLVVTGLDVANSKTFSLTDGVASSVITGNTLGAPWATTLALSDTYNFAITTQPTGQVCAIKEKQFGTLSASFNLNINCVDGYQVAGRFQVPRAQATRIMLYRGNLTTRASGQTNPNSPGVQGGFIYYGNYLDCDGATAGNQYCIYRVGVSTGTAAAHVTGLAGVVRTIVGDGSNLYFATMGPDNRVYKLPQGSTTPIELASGFSDVLGLALDGNTLFISEKTANQIRRLDLTTGVLSTVVSSLANKPLGITLVGTDLYFTCEGEHGVSRIPKTGGAITVPYGSSGTAGHQDNNGPSARFSQPHDLTYDGAENIYLTEYTGHRIRRINLTTGRVTTIVGDGTNATYMSGTGASAKIPFPVGIASDGSSLYFTGHAGSHSVVRLGEANLTAHWPLNGQTTDYANGAFVINYNLTPAGTFTYPIGRSNESTGSHRFDGSNYLTVAHQSQYNLTGYYTISAWINRTATGSMRIVDKVTDGQCDGYAVDITSNDRLRLLYCRSNLAGEVVISGSTIPIGQWVHVLATFSTLKPKASLYINGHLDAEKSTGAGMTLTNALSVRLGADHAAIPGNLFSGAMAEVRLYSRVLSDGEINELAQDASAAIIGSSYNSGATELLSHYSFDALSSNDDGALALNLTNSSVGPVDGKEGDYPGAAGLDGTSGSFLSTTTATLPLGAAPRSLCAFVKPTAQPGTGIRYPIISYGSTSTVLNGSELVYYNQSGTDFRLSMTRFGSSVDAQIKVPMNTWSHVCGTNDGALSRIYLNGTELTTVAGNAQIFTTDAGPLYVGKRVYAPDVSNFRGNIDDVRIYNKALSQNEIRQIATQVPAGLVARYDFTGDKNDVSGRGQHLTNNGANGTMDRFGSADSAANFSSPAYVQATATSLPIGNAARTVCAWTRPTTLLNGTFSEVVMYGANGAATGWGFGMDASGGLPNGRMFILDTAGDMVYAKPHILNIWRHLCATYDGATEQLYLDGTVVASKNLALNTTAGSIVIGRGIFGPGDNFNGDIDDVRFYNRVLSAAEIRALQQQPNKRLQVSAPTVQGDMGGSPPGIVGADQRCPVGFKAMIVDGVNRRACTTANCGGGMDEHIDWVLRANITYVTSTGLLPILTADWNSVWNFAGTAPTGGNLLNEIFNSSQSAWTGLTGNWQVANGGSDHDCSNWSSASGAQTGAYGRTNGLGTNSIFNSTSTCDNGGHYLYCAEQ